ncbi:sulphate transporter [Thermosinus carboxydivorans Nor1]|uniref:Sulphate transporter n=1 Tax=Thermosinus carboxydivorans Nor1 TaxID=401526 RepID=A1HMS1_9FIRM|nr:molybdate transporter family protein [Thermosinus carboxydivorans]EAX48558.1 sulphate transporter [Thermosinus carboxydivorans Nor1]
MRLNRFELAGSLADIGVLLPLVVALAATSGINPFIALLACGLFYLVTGLYYRVPVPVQPLKVFCTVALAARLAPEIIHAGALLIGFLFLALSMPTVMQAIKKLFPLPVIRGIQLGTGLLLVDSGIKLFKTPQVIIGGPAETVALFGMTLPASLLLGIVFTGLLLIAMPHPKYPAALLVVTAGAALAILFGARLTPANPATFSLPELPATSAFLQAFWLLVLPQIPLSLGNAIIATENTLKTYFAGQADRVKANRLAFGMGLFNLLAGLAGGIPCCHGCGGVTAHYRFGARTGMATVLAGLFYILLAAAVYYFGVSVFAFFPYPILGVLLIYVGIEHGLLIQDVQSRQDLAVVIIIAAVTMATRDMTVAFLTGIAFRQIIVVRRILE